MFYMFISVPKTYVVKAIYDFKGPSEGDLTFVKGDMMLITDDR